MESRKANSSSRIIDVVRLQRMMKKWKNLAAAAPPKSNGSSVPKGCVALCVGDELTRFVVPPEYLGHGAFGVLLREAEEEFWFEQEGVLRIPCSVPAFRRALETVQRSGRGFCCCSTEAEFSQPLHSQEPICR